MHTLCVTLRDDEYNLLFQLAQVDTGGNYPAQEFTIADSRYQPALWLERHGLVHLSIVNSSMRLCQASAAGAFLIERGRAAIKTVL